MNDQIKNIRAWNGEVSVQVSGMKEFNKLLQRAKEEALQLNKTIRELENFELKIKFLCDND